MDKVTIQFEKLQSQGKINLAEKVKMSNVDTFKAKLSGLKTIEYNERMIKLQDEEINFWLLHEEGHFVDRKNKYPVFIIWFSIFVIFFTFIQSNDIDYLNLLNLSILIILFVLGFVGLSHHYEYKADDYACKHIDCQLKVKSLFNNVRNNSTIDVNERKKGPKKSLTHPSDDDRISRLHKNHSGIILLE